MSNLIRRLKGHNKLLTICFGHPVNKTIYEEAADLIELQQQRIAELEAKETNWIALSDRKPDVLEVRVKLLDGSEVNCLSQSDGDFYWKCGGYDVFISEHNVTHWMPLPQKSKGER